MISKGIVINMINISETMEKSSSVLRIKQLLERKKFLRSMLMKS